jgi:Flp pilus assembly pilin Flp
MVRLTPGGRALRAQAGSMPRLRREDGQAIVEYGMVIAGISLLLITFVVVTPLDTVFTELVDNIEAAFS